MVEVYAENQDALRNMRPEPLPRRGREFALLLLVTLILGAGYWVVWHAYLPVWKSTFHLVAWRFFLPVALMLPAWSIISAALTRRRCRETLLLPTVALLCGLGLLFLLRLAGGAATQHLQRAYEHETLGVLFYHLYHKQLISFGVALAVLWGMIVGWKDYRQLSRLKYVIATVTVGLLLVMTIFGHSVEGQQVALRLGPLTFQPHDVVKFLMAIFLAAYLVDKQELIRVAAGRFGWFTRMDLRYMGPLVALWLLVLAIVIRHDDLGAAALLFGSFLGILYLGTGRLNYVIFGLLLAVAGALVVYHHVPRVRTRVAVWLNPWPQYEGKGYQICQALMALGNGRVIGAGLAGGYPEQVPAVETDMIYTAVSEDLGLVGAVFVIALYLVLIGRIFHVAMQAEDPFGRLLAAGLAVTFAVQTFTILGGVTKLIPLTGITLPFLSYGGTSLVVNLMLIGVVYKVAEGT